MADTEAERLCDAFVEFNAALDALDIRLALVGFLPDDVSKISGMMRSSKLFDLRRMPCGRCDTTIAGIVVRRVLERDLDR